MTERADPIAEIIERLERLEAGIDRLCAILDAVDESDEPEYTLDGEPVGHERDISVPL